MIERESSGKRGYGSRWQKARATYLRANPLCVICDQSGRIEPATVVDHIQPHKQDQELFWDKSNWQALCKHCHDSYKQQLEKSGTIAGCDASGKPLDPNHPWNKKHG
jgi:5-methylcytosine-specific restriction endonuclease McrA